MSWRRVARGCRRSDVNARNRRARSRGPRAHRSGHHSGTGILARTIVPPPCGLSMLSAPSTAATRSRRPCRPVPAAGSAPPQPSSPTSTCRSPLIRCSETQAGCGTGVLGHVGQRLADEEVGLPLTKLSRGAMWGSRQAVHNWSDHVGVGRGRPTGCGPGSSRLPRAPRSRAHQPSRRTARRQRGFPSGTWHQPTSSPGIS